MQRPRATSLTLCIFLPLFLPRTHAHLKQTEQLDEIKETRSPLVFSILSVAMLTSCQDFLDDLQSFAYVWWLVRCWKILHFYVYRYSHLTFTCILIYLYKFCIEWLQTFSITYLINDDLINLTSVTDSSVVTVIHFVKTFVIIVHLPVKYQRKLFIIVARDMRKRRRHASLKAIAVFRSRETSSCVEVWRARISQLPSG